MVLLDTTVCILRKVRFNIDFVTVTHFDLGQMAKLLCCVTTPRKSERIKVDLATTP